MMLKIAQEMSKNEYPNIRVEDVNVDAMMMWLTKNPENYHVIVSENMFGDIVSDAFAGLIGGLGFATSAQFNPETGVCVFEPTHGSAPKYADFETSIVNPIAMILSAVMMLEHIGEDKIANRIKDAVLKVVAEGKVRAYDMLKMSGKQEVINNGAASTKQMADAIIAKLK